MARRDLGEWVPRTTLGKLVLKGEVTTMSEALATGLRLREPEIVDILLPEMEDEVLDVNMVQRMTDSGRRVNFVITVVVGNGDGFVGLGRARGREVGPSIRKAIDDAKLNIVEVKRGCGSWECGCLRAHTLPIKVTGRSGSVRVTLKPAPQGVGLAVGDVAKAVLRLGGIRDAWAFTQGRTKTTVNYALATFDAVRRSTLVKVTSAQSQRLKIHAGAEEVFVRGTPGAEAPPEAEVPAEGDAPVVETTEEATEPKDAEEAPAEMPEAPKDKEPEGNEGAEPAADTESKEES